MLALIDADILRYELGAYGEGVDGPLSFDTVADALDTKIEGIMRAAECDKCILFLTDGPTFRDEIAVTKPYKGQRKTEKPFHFCNISAYMRNQYDVIQVDGLEADDLMALAQLRDLDGTCICSRDKDLRMIPGWHYGWECGGQREMFKHWVTEEGMLFPYEKGDKAIKGNGLAFFYSQLLTGDQVDNIPGLPRCGPVKAWSLLKDKETHEMLDIVREAYGDDELLREQGRLLWMTRELNEDGTPVLWDIPN